MERPQRLARARVALLGMSVAEAIGESYGSFGYATAATAERLARRELMPRRPLPWTDDTAMALSVVEVLARHGTIVTDDLAAAFARRFAAEPERGYGQGAFVLLTRIAHGASWRDEARAMFRGEGSMGNGAAMRASPLGAYFADDLDAVAAEAARSAEPTHAHPDGAAGAVAVAIATALAWRGTQGEPLQGHDLVSEVARRTPAGPTRTGLEAAAALPFTTTPETAGDRLGCGRFALSSDTVPLAVWIAARHLDSYEEAVWTAAAPYGDRDTVCAMVGGIVVMAAGEGAIPVAWKAVVEPLPRDV